MLGSVNDSAMSGNELGVSTCGHSIPSGRNSYQELVNKRTYLKIYDAIKRIKITLT